MSGEKHPSGQDFRAYHPNALSELFYHIRGSCLEHRNMAIEQDLITAIFSDGRIIDSFTTPTRIGNIREFESENGMLRMYLKDFDGCLTALDFCLTRGKDSFLRIDVASEKAGVRYQSEMVLRPPGELHYLKRVQTEENDIERVENIIVIDEWNVDDPNLKMPWREKFIIVEKYQHVLKLAQWRLSELNQPV